MKQLLTDIKRLLMVLLLVNALVMGFSGLVSAAFLHVGDDFGGGKVAYILQRGDAYYIEGKQSGLIAANANMAGLFNWSAANAACEALVENGFSDWHLPGKEDLNRLHGCNCLAGGFPDAEFWSSEQAYQDYAWGQYFGDGYQYYANKSNRYKVRAVRNFQVPVS
ncbi:Lcl C-terminal domain-containing protein [Chlorobium phaeobacteroides]|jgi:hypothetical protein|uniref:Lcl C-terminal domain-containing protein n=1 Tax=Chlorobium phaeobacteroides (strain DSM 266 / SMG 266 / 2430) TaxID=290317 RepID=A1BDV1_CHLPD|nr:DUF1566 domain-containing protein [Chlorobium phaeobacteroides]ABL64578.1 hypothetical protein Cpha266_0521 [Chlorobium phaeobacteroides DSM 266]MBV5326369.1 DUF1566 domain-containing protein [Chlorobium sp.]